MPGQLIVLIAPGFAGKAFACAPPTTVPEPEPDKATFKTGSLVKTAPTFFAHHIVTQQVEKPVQAPDQPPKTEPEAGVAVR